MTTSYCEAPECERETREGRTYCEAHEKRRQRGQPLSGEIQPRLSPRERLHEAAYRFADASSEDDEEWRRADRALMSVARSVGARLHGPSIAEGIRRARERGVRIGRPRAVPLERIRETVEQLGAVGAARALGIHRATVNRAMQAWRERNGSATTTSQGAR